jgi:hypothetical protein
MADKEQIARIFESMKGLVGSANTSSDLMGKTEDLIAVMDIGDFVKGDIKITIPIAADLWYLWYHDNFLEKYYANMSGKNFDFYDYESYLESNMDFLKKLLGLKPLKVLTDLRSQLSIKESFFSFVANQYENNGIFWVNTIAFEMWGKGKVAQYASDGPKGYAPNDYVGYISFPVGQLGVMEVLSLMQETELSGYPFAGVDSNPKYLPKAAPEIKETDKPNLQSPPDMFPDAKNGQGGILAGQNYCYGKHLIESAYLVPEAVKRDVELLSKKMEKYDEDVEPKKWMRYWVHKNSTLPVPGEFIGILCRPVAIPPHVWWFQESSPFLYAGNWMETYNLTSGVVTAVKLEADRPAGSVGNEYTVKVQGCSIKIYSTDFYDYKVGDRVAIMKLDSTETAVTNEQKEAAKKSFTWLDQDHLDSDAVDTVQENYILIPCTFYKLKA